MALPVKSDFGNSLDLVDIEKIESNVVAMKDGSLKQIVMVGGVNFALKSETEKIIITQGYQNFLNSIDFPMQIVVHSRKVNIGKYVAELATRKDSEDSPLLRSQIDEYVEFIKGFVEKNAIMEKTFLIVVPFYPTVVMSGKKAASSMFPFFKKKNANPAIAAANDEELARIFKENVAQLGQRTGQVLNGLLTIGLDVTVLENDALVELFYNFYNPQTVEREGITIPHGQDEKGQHA